MSARTGSCLELMSSVAHAAVRGLSQTVFRSVKLDWKVGVRKSPETVDMSISTSGLGGRRRLTSPLAVETSVGSVPSSLTISTSTSPLAESALTVPWMPLTLKSPLAVEACTSP